MAFRGGFYNSQNGDRKYYAEDFARLISSLINDGVIKNYGKSFEVKATTGMNVTVDTGLAWFKDTWLHNDAIVPETVPQSDLIFTRIDAFVMEFDKVTRINTTKWISGTPSTEPIKPILEDTESTHQEPIFYVEIPANATTITQANIEYVVGTETPWATSILQTTDIDALFVQWGAMFTEWFNLTVDKQEQMLIDFQEAINNIVAGEETMLKFKYDPLGRGACVTNQLYNMEIDLESIAPAYYLRCSDFQHDVLLATKSIIHGYFKAMYSHTFNGIIQIYMGGEGASLVTEPFAVIGGESVDVTVGQLYSVMIDYDTKSVSFKSGGATQNYKVVGGTSQPTTPKENTIWIDTDVNITDYAIESTNHWGNTPAELGNIWIASTSESEISFSAEKKRNIEIFLGRTTQYVNDVWGSLNAYIFQESVWKQFSSKRISILDTLEEYNKWTATRTAGAGSVLKSYDESESTMLARVLNGYNDNTVGIFAYPAIDATSFTKFHAEYIFPKPNVGCQYSLRIGKTSNTSDILNLYPTTGSSSYRTVDADLSGVTGLIYIYAVIWTNSGAWNNVTFKNMYLE